MQGCFDVIPADCNMSPIKSRAGSASSLAFVMLTSGPTMMSSALSVRADVRPSPDVQSAVDVTATRFVRTWGFTTVGMVAQRFRLTTTTNESRLSLTRQALCRAPDLRWLDPICEWFTLIECDSRPKAALAKILAVSGDVDREELARALDKRHSFREVPYDVVRAYLAELVSHHARVAAPRHAGGLTRVEHVLVDVLHERGGCADIHALRRDVKRRSITPAALKRTLSESPLFLRVAHGIYGLVGAGAGVPVGPRTLISSDQWGQWAAAV
jgi:hypothetical protein